MRPGRVAVLTNVPLAPTHTRPTGWRDRYRMLIQGLSEHHEVLVVTLESGYEDAFDRTREGIPSAVAWERCEMARGRRGLLSLPRLMRAGLAWALPQRTGPTEHGLGKLLHRWQPQVVVGLTPEKPSLVRHAAAKWPTLLFAEEDLTPSRRSNAHNDGIMTRLVRRVERAKEQRLRPRPDVVAVISDRERPWCTRCYPEAECVVVPHTIDLEFWSADPDLGESPPLETEDVFVIGDFSQRRNWRGLERILGALALLPPAEVPTIRLASGRPVDAQLLDATRDLPGFEHVGAIRDPRPFYKASRIALVPAFDVSGVKTQILEAWAAGRPVVASTAAAASVGGRHRDDLSAGDTPDKVAKLLVEALYDPGLRERLATSGQRRVRADFSPEAAWAPMLRAVDALMAGSTSRPQPPEPAANVDARLDRGAGEQRHRSARASR